MEDYPRRTFWGWLACTFGAHAIFYAGNGFFHCRRVNCEFVDL